MRAGRLVAAATTVTLCAGVLLPTAPAGAATPSAATQFIADINHSRAARHLRPVAANSELNAVALKWASTMAKHRSLSHNPDLATAVHHWSGLAENVGMGQAVWQLHVAFMNSAAHKANILNPAYSQVGVGVVVIGHELFVVEDFRRPA